MNLEQLDGFLAALICGPEIVRPSEYLPVISDMVFEDSFGAQSVLQDFLSLIMRHWNVIADTLHSHADLGLGPPPRRYDPKSKLSRAVTPDGEAADYCQTFISSSHCNVVFTACLRAHFDVVQRKLIPKLQAFSQCIQETRWCDFTRPSTRMTKCSSGR